MPACPVPESVAAGDARGENNYDSYGYGSAGTSMTEWRIDAGMSGILTVETIREYRPKIFHIHNQHR